MSSFGSQQFLYPAKPFNELNPSGISSEQSLQTLQTQQALRAQAANAAAERDAQMQQQQMMVREAEKRRQDDNFFRMHTEKLGLLEQQRRDELDQVQRDTRDEMTSELEPLQTELDQKKLEADRESGRIQKNLIGMEHLKLYRDELMNNPQKVLDIMNSSFGMGDAQTKILDYASKVLPGVLQNSMGSDGKVNWDLLAETIASNAVGAPKNSGDAATHSGAVKTLLKDVLQHVHNAAGGQVETGTGDGQKPLGPIDSVLSAIGLKGKDATKPVDRAAEIAAAKAGLQKLRDLGADMKGIGTWLGVAQKLTGNVVGEMAGAAATTAGGAITAEGGRGPSTQGSLEMGVTGVKGPKEFRAMLQILGNLSEETGPTPESPNVRFKKLLGGMDLTNDYENGKPVNWVKQEGLKAFMAIIGAENWEDAVQKLGSADPDAAMGLRDPSNMSKQSQAEAILSGLTPEMRTFLQTQFKEVAGKASRIRSDEGIEGVTDSPAKLRQRKDELELSKKELELKKSGEASKVSRAVREKGKKKADAVRGRSNSAMSAANDQFLDQ